MSSIGKVFESFPGSKSFLFDRILIGCFGYFGLLIAPAIIIIIIIIRLEFDWINLKAREICLRKYLTVIELEMSIDFAVVS